MSVTVSQQPQSYTPARNKQIFVASSDQVAQPNFTYTVIITDLESATSKTHQIAQRPDTLCVFNGASFAQSFLPDHYIPMNLYGFQQSNSIRAIRVNIGETYGSPPVYYAGSNDDYIIWNAVVDWKDWPGYDEDDYLYDNTTSNYVYLTHTLDDITYEDRSYYFYFLTAHSGDVTSLIIETLDANGAFIAYSYIANPYESGVVYDDKYLAIDIGHKGLSNISSGDVTGAYPILTDQVYSYNVYTDIELIKNIEIKCEPVYPVYTIHYLNKKGAFVALNFSKRSDVELRKTSTTYKKNPYEMSGGSYGYSRSAAYERILTSIRTESMKLNTDWLSDEMVEVHQDILDAPLIYLDLGPDEDFLQIRLVNGSYKLNKKYNEKLYSLSLEFEYCHENTRQL